MTPTLQRGTFVLISLCALLAAALAWHTGNLDASLNGTMIALFSLSIALDPAFVSLELRDVFAGTDTAADEARSSAGAELCFWLALVPGAWLLARALPGA